MGTTTMPEWHWKDVLDPAPIVDHPPLDLELLHGRHEEASDLVAQELLHRLPVVRTLARVRSLAVGVVEVGEGADQQLHAQVVSPKDAQGRQAVGHSQGPPLECHVEVEEIAPRSATEDRLLFRREDPRGVEAPSLDERRQGVEDEHGDVDRVALESGRENVWNPRHSQDEVIEGRLADEEGKPVASWWVEAIPAPYANPGVHAVRKVETGADGTFRMLNLEPGTYALWIRPTEHGAPAIVREGVVAGGPRIDVTVGADSRPTAGLTGRIRLPGDAVPEAARVWLSSVGAGGTAVERATWDPESGRFEATAIPPGDYHLMFSSRDALRRVTLEREKILDLEELRQPPAHLRR